MGRSVSADPEHSKAYPLRFRMRLTENCQSVRSERSAIIGAAQPGVHGPDPSEDRATKKERSNESMEHMALMCCLLLLPGISYTAADG
jgi:hypothetical protein